MTAAQIRIKVLRAFRLPSTETSFDDEILAHINDALDIISLQPVIQLVETAVSLTTATRKYALPAGVNRVDMCYISGNDYGLSRVAPEEIYKYDQITLTGEPRLFWEDNENIYVHPIPDTTYTLNVMAKGSIPAVALIADPIYLVGTTLLADAYTNAIQHYVVWRLAIPEKADYQYLINDAKENWSALLAEAVKIDKSRQSRRYGGAIPKRGATGGFPNRYGWRVR